MAREKIKGKIILDGQIKCSSPLHIGSGSGDRSDLDIILNEKGNPFIPATSFVGVLRHLIEPLFNHNANQKDKFDKLFGFTEENDGQQSSFQCNDLICQTESPNIIIRDGIKIDNTKGIVEDKGKYDFELVERGTIFDLNMEFKYIESNEQFVKQTVATIYSLLNKGEIKIGAKTNSGFGEIQLVQEQTKIYEFNFSKKSDVIKWLNQDFTDSDALNKKDPWETFEINKNIFSIEASLQLKNSLIVRSYSDDPKMPDSIHIKSLDDWILPGTSLKGAIRARAERILNTLQKPKTILDELFGYVDPQRPSPNAKKGKIRIREIILPRFIAELQTRIKIDRFTGGTIEAALFDSMPLFVNLKDKLLNIEIHVVNIKDAEVGLLLLVLKDLWSGDLAVGGEKNVGRGVFQGVTGFIKFKEEVPILIEGDLDKLSDSNKEKLQNFVNALTSEK